MEVKWGLGYFQQRKKYDVFRELKSFFLVKCVRYREDGIEGVGRGQSWVDCVCVVVWILFVRLQRINLERVIFMCLVGVIGLIFGFINKMWSRGDQGLL